MDVKQFAEGNVIYHTVRKLHVVIEIIQNNVRTLWTELHVNIPFMIRFNVLFIFFR